MKKGGRILKISRLSLLLIALLVVAFVATGCGGTKQGDNNPAADSGQIIRYNVGTEPETMDPALATGIPESTIMLQIWEGLTRLDKDDLPQAAIAKSWDVTEDGIEYVFHLRESKWSNGDPLTAHDFEFAWKRILNPELAADYAYMMYPIKNAEAYNTGKATADQVGVVALDDHTLKVTLEAPTPYFLSLTAFKTYYPLHQPTVKANDAGWALKVDTIIGNGPFKIVRWAEGKMEFEPNQLYWDRAAVKLDKLVFTMIENESTELTMFETGQLDMTHQVPRPEIPRLKQSNEFKVYSYFGTYYYIFQTEKPPLDDVRVRKALALAIDREAIVNNITQAGEIPAYAFVPPGIPEPNGNDFRDVGGDYLTANVEEAKRLLAEAGYPEGQGFPPVEILYNTNEMHKIIAEAIQEMWRRNLGITGITLTNQEWGVYLKTRDMGDFTISRAGWIGDYLDPTTFLDMWTTGNGNNNSRWGSAEYDALVAEARVTVDPVARMEIMHRLESILMEEMPIMPIYYYTEPKMVKEFVRGYNKSAINGPDFKEAYIQK